MDSSARLSAGIGLDPAAVLYGHICIICVNTTAVTIGLVLLNRAGRDRHIVIGKNTAAVVFTIIVTNSAFCKFGLVIVVYASALLRGLVSADNNICEIDRSVAVKHSAANFGCISAYRATIHQHTSVIDNYGSTVVLRPVAADFSVYYSKSLVVCLHAKSAAVLSLGLVVNDAAVFDLCIILKVYYKSTAVIICHVILNSDILKIKGSCICAINTTGSILCRVFRDPAACHGQRSAYINTAAVNICLVSSDSSAFNSAEGVISNVNTTTVVCVSAGDKSGAHTVFYDKRRTVLNFKDMPVTVILTAVSV